MTLPEPLKFLGFTTDGKPVLGGAFHMADTWGVPLVMSITIARERGLEMSLPHYFACALEHGWRAEQAFSHIRDALSGLGRAADFQLIHDVCVSIFARHAKQMTDPDCREVARKMRLELEQSAVPA